MFINLKVLRDRNEKEKKSKKSNLENDLDFEKINRKLKDDLINTEKKVGDIELEWSKRYTNLEKECKEMNKIYEQSINNLKNIINKYLAIILFFFYNCKKKKRLNQELSDVNNLIEKKDKEILIYIKEKQSCENKSVDVRNQIKYLLEEKEKMEKVYFEKCQNIDNLNRNLVDEESKFRDLYFENQNLKKKILEIEEFFKNEKIINDSKNERNLKDLNSKINLSKNELENELNK